MLYDDTTSSLQAAVSPGSISSQEEEEKKLLFGLDLLTMKSLEITEEQVGKERMEWWYNLK